MTIVLAASAVAIAPVGGAGAAEVPWIDTTDRAAVLAGYSAVFDAPAPATGSTTDVDACTAGATSPAHREAMVARVNWYRRMAGLGSVTERAADSTSAQQAALMMAAQGALSHGPDAGWACHTTTGATAASRSNLALGVNGVAAVDAYVRDPGPNNLAVGHRRTVLYPQLREIGIGDVDAGPGHHAANALHVFDDHLWDDRPAVREPRGFVAWPPSGYVPAETVWARWSFSLAGADFSAASVSVVGDDGPRPLTIVARLQADQPGTRTAPEPTLVWAMGGPDDSGLLPAPTDGDDCVTVTVSGVRVDGVAQQDIAYRTCVIDPDAPPTPLGSAGTGEATSNPGATGCERRSFEAWTTPCWTDPWSLAVFADVTLPWQREAVDWLVANGVTTGVGAGRFDPDAPVTRAQAATLVWRLAGAPAPGGDAPGFADVPADAWFADAVAWMAEHDITTGTGPDRFAPSAPATRAEFVAFLWRLVDQPTPVGDLRFADLRAPWQEPAVRWAAGAGITTGTSDTTFTPDGIVTRGQAAALLARLADRVS